MHSWFDGPQHVFILHLAVVDELRVYVYRKGLLKFSCRSKCLGCYESNEMGIKVMINERNHTY